MRRDANSPGAASKGGDREVPLEGAGRVVIVAEKARALRRKVRNALERYGYTVFEARDGEQALQLSKHMEGAPDLLMTDAELPKLSGRELVDELAIAGRLPKVMFLSGGGEPADRAPRPSGHDYPSIAMPFDARQLAACVGAVLSEWE